jgi:predicted DNA-binding antitoxin AbrB/MazE fold protein
MDTIHAVYQDGVFRPLEPITLPERCEVEFEPRIVKATTQESALAAVYSVLSRRYESGDAHGAERHSDHQP